LGWETKYRYGYLDFSIRKMMIPYIIDNQNYKLADILNSIIEKHTGQSMDVVTAYFNIQGYNLLKEGLSGLGSFKVNMHKIYELNWLRGSEPPCKF